MPKKIIYQEGQKIDNLIYISDAIKSKGTDRMAMFQCVCGILFKTRLNDVKKGGVKSCGCLPHPRKKERLMIKCACGCDGELVNISKSSYERKFIHGHNKANEGNSHSDDTKKLMSELKIGKSTSRKGKSIPWATGEKNNHWKGGITPINEKIRKSIEYKLWRNAVFERDNYTCVCCKEKEKASGKLEAHHIKSFAQFPELRFAIDNGQTLCKECHKMTDTYLNKARWLKIA